MSQKDETSVESGHDTAFAKDSGKVGIVKDTQAGIVGDNAKAEGGKQKNAPFQPPSAESKSFFPSLVSSGRKYQQSCLSGGGSV